MSQNETATVTLDHILAHTNDGVFVLDRNRRFVLFNPACERLTGFTAAELAATGCTCHDATDCEDEQGRSLAGRLCPGLGIFSGELPTARQRMRITAKSGEHRWVEALYTTLGTQPEGGPEFVLVVMRDISEQKEREDQWIKTIEELRAEVERLREQLRERYGFAGIVSRSPLMQAVLERIRAACAGNSPVLISGEPGTGKEMIARTIICNGLQKDGPFVKFSLSATPPDRVEAELFGCVRGGFADCGAECESLLRSADGGTLFIKDIDRMPNSTQARLLQCLQDRAVRPLGATTYHPVNVRILASTSRSVEDLLTSGTLREDLYYRLSVITIEVPPLRSRKEDIPVLVEHFIHQLNQQSTRKVTEVSPAVWAALDAHDWPGNVRELQTAIESAFAGGSGPVLQQDGLTLAGGGRRSRPQPAESDPVALDTILADTERRAILAALRRAHGQRSLAARLMGVSRSRLYRRMEALGIASRKDELRLA